jgi:squalene-hopene/tetraprenyl-beta-curcumene cyclase
VADAESAIDPGYALRETLPERVADATQRARRALLGNQSPDAYWCFELEADCTIPAEYILMCHFMDEMDEELEARIANYLRAMQADHGGWPLYKGGEFELSCSVKVYYALKLAGDDINAPHMVRAREAILARDGAAHCNVFTRITLALFGQIPWRGVPFVPVEMMLLPRWFFFHISKVSYWSRTVMVPLSVLCSLKARAKNPKGVHIRELFSTPPEKESHYSQVRSKLNMLFLALEATGRRLEHLVPNWIRRQAVKKAEAWFVERLNGTEGLGGIFPAMVNAHEALGILGYPADHPYRVITAKALRRLVVERGDMAYCQPCTSPVWDTALAAMAVREASGTISRTDTIRAMDWLRDRQLLDEPGDWRDSRRNLRGGGWPFQFSNDHYPDLDDTAVVAWAMLDVDGPRYLQSVERAAEWICGMQSKNGGFAAFDVDNTHYYLNEIPFADHGALLDPPTSDVTARCVALLAKLDPIRFEQEIHAALRFLYNEQEPEGCWFGRWGTNYIYGTWSVLVALEIAGEPLDHPAIRRGVEWFKRTQRPDGGWGESNDSYLDQTRAGRGDTSTSFQTAWALLGLMAAGEAGSNAVRRGVDYLLMTQRADGLWDDDEYTAPGFPRVFYLKYHGYSRYFPLWALARYRTLREKLRD